MRTLNNKNKIDRAVAAVENVSTGEEKMSNSSKKTPWFLRFAGAILAVAGILLALPNGEIQSQSNSPTTNSVPIPTDHPTRLGPFDDARSRTDCYIIFMRERMKRQDYFDNLLEPHRTAYKKEQEKCDARRKTFCIKPSIITPKCNTTPAC